MENFNRNPKSFKRRVEDFLDDPIPPTAVALSGMVITGFGSYFAGYASVEMPPRPEGQFEIINVDTKETILKQDGKEYIIKTSDIPAPIKREMIRRNPKLESFLEDGPINIIDTK